MGGVQFLQIDQGVVFDRTGCVGRAGYGFIVQDDQLPISGAADIHFKHVDSQFNCLPVGVKGAFRAGPGFGRRNGG
jgi:hypothetical protein